MPPDQSPGRLLKSGMTFWNAVATESHARAVLLIVFGRNDSPGRQRVATATRQLRERVVASVANSIERKMRH
jgi:hypothetical protein